MSDLTGGGPSGSTGNGRTVNNGASRMPATAPVPTGSPGRLKAPTDIMRERMERMARKADREREALEMERARAEQEQRSVEEDRIRRAEKRAVAAGVAGENRDSGGDGYKGSGSTQAPQQRISGNSEESQRASGGNTVSARPQDAPIQGRGRGTALGGDEAVGAAPGRARGPSVSQGQPRPVRPGLTSGAAQAQAGPSTAPPTSQLPQETGEGSGSGPNRRTTTSSFPHAFERWETLSSHWEGLTSFWIRKLEENANEIQRDPLSVQLSRQVTDLSAAGANLFHAVVELQRLRASSERKFQRWFFETRAEQERAQELQAMLEATLQEERRGRAEAVADAVARESEKSNSEKLLAEMKRELQISKEEARRAWEELGRREQEERERTMSLRDGHPTLVGGVQVVPMMQGVPSRHASTSNRPHTQEGPWAGGAEPGILRGEALVPAAGDTDPAFQSTSRAQRPADPFIENSRPLAPSSSSGRGATTSQPSSAATKPPVTHFSQAPAVQPPSSSGAFYQHQHGTTLHTTEQPGSEGTYSDTEYDIDPTGQIRRDSRGNKIRYSRSASDDDTDEFDVSADRQRELAHLQQYGHAPVSGIEYVSSTSATAVTGSSSRPEVACGEGSAGGAADYSGQGYGSGPGWESVPRHHHPTRLSDVLEEDERSGTSASRVSRRD